MKRRKSSSSYISSRRTLCFFPILLCFLLPIFVRFNFVDSSNAAFKPKHPSENLSSAPNTGTGSISKLLNEITFPIDIIETGSTTETAPVLSAIPFIDITCNGTRYTLSSPFGWHDSSYSVSIPSTLPAQFCTANVHLVLSDVLHTLIPPAIWSPYNENSQNVSKSALESAANTFQNSKSTNSVAAETDADIAYHDLSNEAAEDGITLPNPMDAPKFFTATTHVLFILDVTGPTSLLAYEQSFHPRIVRNFTNIYEHLLVYNMSTAAIAFPLVPEGEFLLVRMCFSAIPFPTEWAGDYDQDLDIDDLFDMTDNVTARMKQRCDLGAVWYEITIGRPSPAQPVFLSSLNVIPSVNYSLPDSSDVSNLVDATTAQTSYQQYVLVRDPAGTCERLWLLYCVMSPDFLPSQATTDIDVIFFLQPIDANWSPEGKTVVEQVPMANSAWNCFPSQLQFWLTMSLTDPVFYRGNETARVVVGSDYSIPEMQITSPFYSSQTGSNPADGSQSAVLTSPLMFSNATTTSDNNWEADEDGAFRMAWMTLAMDTFTSSDLRNTSQNPLACVKVYLMLPSRPPIVVPVDTVVYNLQLFAMVSIAPDAVQSTDDFTMSLAFILPISFGVAALIGVVLVGAFRLSRSGSETRPRTSSMDGRGGAAVENDEVAVAVDEHERADENSMSRSANDEEAEARAMVPISAREKKLRKQFAPPITPGVAATAGSAPSSPSNSSLQAQLTRPVVPQHLPRHMHLSLTPSLRQIEGRRTDSTLYSPAQSSPPSPLASPPSSSSAFSASSSSSLLSASSMPSLNSSPNFSFGVVLEGQVSGFAFQSEGVAAKADDVIEGQVSEGQRRREFTRHRGGELSIAESPLPPHLIPPRDGDVDSEDEDDEDGSGAVLHKRSDALDLMQTRVVKCSVLNEGEGKCMLVQQGVKGRGSAAANISARHQPRQQLKIRRTPQLSSVQESQSPRRAVSPLAPLAEALALAVAAEERGKSESKEEEDAQRHDEHEELDREYRSERKEDSSALPPSSARRPKIHSLAISAVSIGVVPSSPSQ